MFSNVLRLHGLFCVCVSVLRMCVCTACVCLFCVCVSVLRVFVCSACVCSACACLYCVCVSVLRVSVLRACVCSACACLYCVCVSVLRVCLYCVCVSVLRVSVLRGSVLRACVCTACVSVLRVCVCTACVCWPCVCLFCVRVSVLRAGLCTEVEPWRGSWLHFQKAEGKAPVQTGDGVLRTLEDLKELAGTGGGQRRAGLFYMLVSGLRGLRNETLSSALPRMLDASAALTWQALLQCGTAECDSAALQAVRTVAGMPLEMDALVHGLSLQGHADAGRVRDMLSTAKFRQSKAIMYALAYTVRRYGTTSSSSMSVLCGQWVHTHTDTVTLTELFDWITALGLLTLRYI